MFEELADNIMNAVLTVFKDRKGFDAWWHEVDLETRREIMDELYTIIIIECNED